MKAYKIIRKVYLNDFMAEVTMLLNEGWVLAGGCQQDSAGCYSQALQHENIKAAN